MIIAEWIRLRRQPFVWIGTLVLLYLAWNRWGTSYSLSSSYPHFSLAHVSGLLYSQTNWLAYSYWQLSVDSLDSILCLSAIGALWVFDDLRDNMLVEHYARYRGFPMRLLLQRFSSLLVYCLLIQVAYFILATIFQWTIHGSLSPDLTRAFPQVANLFLYDLIFCFGGFVFTHLWRNVLGGILTVVGLWWTWTNVVQLSIQSWYSVLPHWLSYAIMALFPEPNLYVLRYSSSSWEQAAVGRGAQLAVISSGTPLPGDMYGFNALSRQAVLYLPSNEMAIMILVIEGLLLIFLISVVLRVWLRRVILKQSRTHGKLPFRNIVLIGSVSAMCGVLLWLYVLTPLLQTQSSHTFVMLANQTYTEVTESPGIHNHLVVMRSPAGTVSVRDIYIATIMYYSPTYQSDQVILHKSLENGTRMLLLQDGYNALLDDEEICAAFSRIHPKAWGQIADNTSPPTNMYGMPSSFYIALAAAFQSHHLYPPRLDILDNAVGSWIADRLNQEFPGTTTQTINQRDQLFERQLKRLKTEGAKLISPIPFSQIEQELDR